MIVMRLPEVLLVLFTWFTCYSAAEIRGSWGTLPAMPTARQEVASAVAGGKLYVLGGLGGGTAVEAFDPETGQWESLPPLPMGVHHGSAAALDGKVYSIGGFLDGTAPLFSMPLAEVFEFDPERGDWQGRAPLPSARGGLFSLAWEGKIYAIGGRDALNSIRSVSVYDPSTNQWSPGADLPAALDHLAAAALGGKIYVAGGRRTQNGSFAGNDPSLFSYDPSQDDWDPGSPLPTARSGHAAASLGGFLLVMGGEIPGVFSLNEVYDPPNDRWFRLQDLPTARHGFAAGVIGNRIFTAGGGLVAGLAPTRVSEAFAALTEVESLAQFGVGPSISSQLVISNPGSQPARLRVELHSGLDGKDFQVSLDGEQGSAFEREIAPGALTILTSDPQDSTSSGGVTLYSDLPLLSNVLFSHPQLGFAGVAGLRPGRRFFVSVLRNLEEQSDSGLAVADASGLPNTVTLQLLDESGQTVTQTQRSLQPFGHFAQLFDELWDIEILFLIFNGSIRIEAEHEVGAVAILLKDGQFATLPVRAVD